MRVLFLFLLLATTFYSCETQKAVTSTDKELKFDKNDEGEYDIIVFDSQYDYFLEAVAFPESYYSESYYHNKNVFYVNEWNYRHNLPLRYNPNIYEVSIDYSPQIKYGKTFEYKLYNFFKFIEWKHKIDLEGRN